MKLTATFLLFCSLLFSSCTTQTDANILSLSTTSLTIQIDNQGSLVKLIDTATDTDYGLHDSIVPFMSLRVNNQIIGPISAVAQENLLILTYPNEAVAELKFEEKDTHLTFELVSLTHEEEVELILWGPYPTTIDKIISETVGVVRNDEFAFGIQALTIKTLGGYPWNESDRMPAFDIFKEDQLQDMRPKSDGSVLYRVEAAMPIKNGSSLQAYTRNRTNQRIYSDVGHEQIVAPPYNDGGVIGSKIALFGCPEPKTLERLGEIELAEGLPHPMIDGEWVKTNRNAAAAYLITSFTEKNVDEAIALTKKAGLNYLYHNGKTFENWGHFELNKAEFPNGLASLKNCVDKAAAQGVNLGTHFLSNFITTNDPYVTPIPDKRLAKVGSSTLVNALSATATEIEIKAPDFFNQMKNNSLKTVVVGNELIRYGSVSSQAPWRLLDCQRGAFDTTPQAHQAGDTIAKLLDHPYKVFLTTADLTIEMSKTIANVYNQTGLRQISFDGLEGNRSTGLGTYGESLMPYTWYTSLSEELKKHLIIDASRTTHFFWHIYSRMNWGEPWYAGFRESQTEYRFNNQAYFQRNFMPGMLGWFKMTPETSVEDIEWMLAKSAGYDAGYALVADLSTVHQNGNAASILALIGDWEKLRISNSFSNDQKEVMRDKSREFSLQKIDDSTWNWQEMFSTILIHKQKVRQPGEPLSSTFSLDNPGLEQPAKFSLQAVNCDANGISLELNNYKKIDVPLRLKQGQMLVYKGGDQLFLYTANWQLIKKVAVDFSGFKLKEGENTITIDAQFTNATKDASIKLELRSHGEHQEVHLKN